MANWKKLVYFSITIKERIVNIEDIWNKFDFPRL